MHLNLVDDTRWMSTNGCLRAPKASFDQTLSPAFACAYPFLFFFFFFFLAHACNRESTWMMEWMDLCSDLKVKDINMCVYLDFPGASDEQRSSPDTWLVPGWMNGSRGGNMNMVLLNLSALWWTAIEQLHLGREGWRRKLSFRHHPGKGEIFKQRKISQMISIYEDESSDACFKYLVNGKKKRLTYKTVFVCLVQIMGVLLQPQLYIFYYVFS